MPNIGQMVLMLPVRAGHPLPPRQRRVDLPEKLLHEEAGHARAGWSRGHSSIQTGSTDAMTPYPAMATISCSRDRTNQCPIDEAATGLPRITDRKSPITPMMVASAIRPSRNRYIEAHEQGQRNRHADGEGAPGAFLEGVDHGQAQPGRLCPSFRTCASVTRVSSSTMIRAAMKAES